MHRRRSPIVRQDEQGEQLSVVHIDNDPVAVAEAGPNPEVAIEATHAWVRHEAPYDRVGARSPPVARRTRLLKLEAA